MIQSLLHPVSEAFRQSVMALPVHTWGHEVTFYDGQELDARKTPLAIMGIADDDLGAAAFDEVRAALYALTSPVRGMGLLDLGNIKGGAFGVTEVLEALMAEKITPIMVGGDMELAYAQFSAYERSKRLVNVVAVDNRMEDALSPEGAPKGYLSRLQARYPEVLIQFSCLGYQSPFTDPALIERLESLRYECHRLGKVRANIEEVEPVVRDADMLAFHIAALRHSEVPACPGAAPGGLYIEEASRIARYAGLSDKLTSAGFFGLGNGEEPSTILRSSLSTLHYDTLLTAQTMSQLIWYFVEGFGLRKHDYPIQKKYFSSFVVDIKTEGLQLTFWKSTRSERWWMEVPRSPKTKQAKSRLIPCSYEDYRSACKGELTERVGKATRRME